MTVIEHISCPPFIGNIIQNHRHVLNSSCNLFIINVQIFVTHPK